MTGSSAMSRSLGIAIAVVIAMFCFGLLWQWLAMHDMLTPQRLLKVMQYGLAWRDTPWAILVVAAIYTGASLLVFPLSLLVAVTGLLFGPWWGFVYALAGTLAASMATYWAGRKLGREALLRHGGHRLNGLARRLAGRGIRTMTVVNLLPLAPFTLTNMMAGAFHLRFRDYMLGSLLGIVPGLIGMTLLGSQLASLISAENRSELIFALGGIAVAVLVLLGLKRYATQRQQHPRT